jgi:uncharacterized protein
VSTPYHGIPQQLFDALAAGRGGTEAIGVLAAAQHSKHALLLRGVIEAARDAGADQARCARIGGEVLAEVERHDRPVAARVIRYPAVGAWAVRTLLGRRGDDRTPKAVPARLAAVAAAAAIRSGLDAEVPVLPVNGVVSLPSLGAARVDAESAVVRSRAGRAEVRWARGRVDIPADAQHDALGWQGLRSCHTGEFTTVIEDLDPFRMPAVDKLAPRLTAGEARYWASSLRQGWQVLTVGHPGIAAEVAAAVSVIVPLTQSVHGHISSSSPETFGAVAMSLPPDPDTCASTLTHELQHLKLCAILDIVRLTRPDDGRRYYAPWRSDPRPAAGLLQGAYAYLGVTEFWRVQRRLAADGAQRRAEEEFALWRAGTVRTIGTLLSSKRLTPEGMRFVQRMAQAASVWAGEQVLAEAQAAARRSAARHLAQWEATYGPSRSDS